ncbi:MAG: hypothetical protein OMM_00765 [Candidatus Magnetoglobus multicellularis str. Araruama]|uniref:YkgJ family cysteine cluster protein n=1 Tax=Candidatus Magnetoglobus multicellularis str. Araruama TaxID=890399 RepID=A0A1V1PG90_9BACT|nr:MAG: hypothetical protein OMM_00765 [Candidatus Magnetoglobus multicellularis str. Araruama]
MQTFQKKYKQKLTDIYQQMDHSYQESANAYDFVCNGCEDNCCNTRFFHHTHIEFAYLVFGLRQLSDHKQNEIIQLASQVCQKSQEMLSNNQLIRLMCPLNEKGKCILYDSRPMICRLHGLAHELRFPGKPVQYTPGCNAFSQHFKLLNLNHYHTFDRTPHYIQMAQLENQFREEYQIDQRFKMTIAEMIVLPWQKNHSIVDILTNIDN